MLITGLISTCLICTYPLPSTRCRVGDPGPAVLPSAPAKLRPMFLKLMEGELGQKRGEGKGSGCPNAAPRPPCTGLTCLLRPPPSPQLKISFSETALETTYQYPSESSVLRELGPEPEAPSAPGAPAAPPDEDEDEEEELPAERPGGLRSKALLVGECGRRLASRAGTAVPEGEAGARGDRVLESSAHCRALRCGLQHGVGGQA